MEAYRKAIELCPDHRAARHNLARPCLVLERFDEAIEHYEQLRRDRHPYVYTRTMDYKHIWMLEPAFQNESFDIRCNS
jgi:hypothetical protein